MVGKSVCGGREVLVGGKVAVGFLVEVDVVVCVGGTGVVVLVGSGVITGMLFVFAHPMTNKLLMRKKVNTLVNLILDSCLYLSEIRLPSQI